jgi:hypothetical protein
MSAVRKISLFTLWYVCNVVYNDCNRTLLRGLRLPWTMASLQLGIGLLFIVPLWLSGLRSPPRLRQAELRSLLVPAMIHAAGQMVTVASLGAGALPASRSGLSLSHAHPRSGCPLLSVPKHGCSQPTLPAASVDPRRRPPPVTLPLVLPQPLRTAL